MAITINDCLKWLEDTSLASGIRKSLWMYPGLEIVHITGIVFLVGAAFMFDLRLLGFSKDLPVISLARHLLTWSRRGLLLVVPSGILLFITNAEALGNDPVFWLKMTFLVIAGINAGLFHWFIVRSSPEGRNRNFASTGAKLAGVLSLIIWIAIIACGRLLAY